MNNNEWQNRTSAAAAAFGISVEDFQKQLQEKMGIAADNWEQTLEDEDIVKFGDFRETFKEVPIVKLRLAFKALKGGKFTKTDENKMGDSRLEQLKALGLKIRLEDAETSLLLPYYQPDKLNDPVTVALKKRFGDKPVIIFLDDGLIAVEESLKYIADIEQGYPENTDGTVNVKGVQYKLYPIGVRPNQMVQEDPLFPGEPLRDGYSIVNHRNWKDISDENKQRCRIIVERGDIDPRNRDAVLRLLERAQAGTLKEAYPEADLEFRQRKERDELPKLKIPLGARQKQNNPFGVKKQY